MQAIYDTNVFVAAGFNPQSASAELLEAARDGRVTLVWDEATRREIRGGDGTGIECSLARKSLI